MTTTERREPNASGAGAFGAHLDDRGYDRVAAPVLPSSYWRQWSASVVSNLGDGINFVAMPLLALSLTDDARLLALTTFVLFVPWLAFGLPVGVMVDRYDRRRLMITANLLRVGLFGMVAIGAAAGWLGIPMLLLLLLLIGCGEVLFDSSAQAFLPMIVEPELLSRANGLLFAAEVVAGSIVGLSIGALLFDVAVGLPFIVNAVSFAVAALLIATIRTRRPAAVAVERDDDDRRFGLGLQWLWDDHLLRTLAMMFAVTNLGLMFGQGIFVKYAVDELGLTSAEFGILLAVTAMGAATGGLVGHRVMSAIGLRAAVIVPYLAFGAGNVIISLAESAWIVALTGFVVGAAVTIWNVVTVTVRQRLIPSYRFGRVNGVYRWLGACASAIGVALGGLVAHHWSVRTPFLVGGVISMLAAALFARPVLAGLGAERGGQPAIVPPAPRTPAPPSIT